MMSEFTLLDFERFAAVAKAHGWCSFVELDAYCFYHTGKTIKELTKEELEIIAHKLCKEDHTK